MTVSRRTKRVAAYPRLATRKRRAPQAEAVHGKAWTYVPSSTLRSRPARARTRPASYSSPTGPVLRANPFPEVTDLICRLPLPTLFDQLEAVHLGDLLRIWVRSGTRITQSPSDFHGSTRAHQTPQEPRCFTGQHPYLRASRFQGVRPLQRRENSSWGSRRRLRVRLRCRTSPLRDDLRVRVREY